MFDFLKRTIVTNHISWIIDNPEGVAFVFDKEAMTDHNRLAINDPYFGLQLALLKTLEEQGEALRNHNGFTIPFDIFAQLDEVFYSYFGLPDLFEGAFVTNISGATARANFNIEIALLLPDGEEVKTYKTEGCFIHLSDSESYRLSLAQFQGLKAVVDHQNLASSERGEYENNWCVFQLKLARDSGMEIDLSHFKNIDVIQPEGIGVSVEKLQNGELVLTPTVGGGLSLDDIKDRLAVVESASGHCIFKVNNTFVLLDEDRLSAAQQILTNRNISKEQVSSFLESPTAYLDAALIDLDTGFSLRVHGAEKFEHKYFGETEKSGVDWFARDPHAPEPIGNLPAILHGIEDVNEVIGKVEAARKTNADIIELSCRKFDISDVTEVEKVIKKIQDSTTRNTDEPSHNKDEHGTEKLEAAVVAIDKNDDDEGYAYSDLLKNFDPTGESFERDNLNRDPYPHQEFGIQWMLAHMSVARITGGGGALLADDMGLGKTYMVLVSIAEWYRRCRLANITKKPVLIVAPLSLLENWQDEVEKTFLSSPFIDIVTLQTGGDLSKYKVVGGKKETNQAFDDKEKISDLDGIRYSLKVGGMYGSDRLDKESRLVLTTYDTLRDYQFSLSRIDWSVVAFDEAQNIKNPNTLATRAAKALKTDFKLLATGTPVENSLKDYWCLMDTCTPGLLGSWQSFRTEYITPITDASELDLQDVKIGVGKALREVVGEYMLRRTKESELEKLPKKTIFSGDASGSGQSYLVSLNNVMSGPQLEAYNAIVESVQATEDGKQQVVLQCLHALKTTSIHHEISSTSTLPSSGKEILSYAQRSVKIKMLLSLLDEIKKRQEKVIVFATTKVFQAFVSALVTAKYGVIVDVINGDTKAVASKAGVETRKGIIDKFQSKPGFGVILMSPVAAGVGLTVVGANNVIHLERHWNPAKEAQATDRVYRIGQDRDVSVYIPMAMHPSIDSFDLKLNSLLANKIDLSEAVVSIGDVDINDLSDCL